MLPRKERLSRLEFNRFFSVGKRIHSPSFQMVYAWNDTFHASVVVSKKVARLAVARNKIRRRIYDIVRNYKSHTNGQGVYIFVAKAPVVKNSFDVLKQEVHTSMDSVIKK